MKLQFSRRADKDLDRLYDFLITAQSSKNTAARAMIVIKEGAIHILDNPEIGTVLDDNTNRRELIIKFGKNNYVLRYIPDYEIKTINILRIYHSREDR